MAEIEPRIIRGFCLIYTDQGMDGSALTVYDSSKTPQGNEELVLDGLHPLQEGDVIRVFRPGDPIYETVITQKHQLTSTDRFRGWIGNDPERERFISYFGKEDQAELTTKH